MDNLNSLIEQLRPVARDVLPSNPLRTVHLTNTNRYTRIYLRRIIQQARNYPFSLLITDGRLARLFRLSKRRFTQWFRHGVRLLDVFRRARWFIREMIRINILEDHPELATEEEEEEGEYRNTIENTKQLPDDKTMEGFRERTRMIRKEGQNREPVIKDLYIALEILECIEDAWNSLLSISEDDNESNLGEDPDEEHTVDENSPITLEESALNGPPSILFEQEFNDQFKNILVSDDANNDNKVGPSSSCSKLIS